MNSILTNPDRRMHGILYAMTRSTGVVCVFASALVLASCLNAQEDAPNKAVSAVEQPEPDVYTVKFDGGHVGMLMQQLKEKLPGDNVLIAPSARDAAIGPFEVRHVRLQDLASTIEFLSEGRLTVEVVPREKGMIGNIWRIASKHAAGPAATMNLKMRSVAAPNLFGDDENVKRIIAEASELEEIRLKIILETASVRGGDFSGVAKTEIKPLKSQKVFVLVGNEDGIAGVESFVKAAEQLTVDLAAKKRALAASLAPKMRAVFAPHLFASEKRLDQITEEFDGMQGLWNESHNKMMQIVGIDDRRGGVCVQHRPDQKLFVLIGSEGDIAGMESLIQAAEKNAADEDAKLAEAQARIEELEQQYDVARQKLEFEERMKIERKKKLISEMEETERELELRKQDGKVHSPQEWEKLVAEKDAHIKTLEKALSEGDTRSSEQIEQLKLAILEIRARLDAVRSKAGSKE